MADRAFEQYRDTLQRGHVAALRGDLDAAIEAYREAAAIAPDRAIPLTSLGGALRRLGRDDEALTAFGKALERAPSDVIALVGRAEILASTARGMAAAEAYLALAAVHEAEGRRAEAADAARRAVELLDVAERRGSMGRIVDRLRRTEGDPGSTALVERARLILARTADEREPADRTAEASVEPTGDAQALDGRVETRPTPASFTLDGPPRAAGVGPGRTPEQASAPESDESLPTATSSEPVRVAVPPVRRDPLALILSAERRVDAGDVDGALDAYLAAATALAGEHQWRVALDACAQALAIAPTDRRLHLDMAELYLAAGWASLAAEKLRLVRRIADLDDDHASVERVCAIVRVWLADDPELAALCG